MTIQRAAEIGDFVGRTLEGVAYRYERPSRVTDDGWRTSYYEEIMRAADTKTLRDHPAFPLDKQHDRVSMGTVSFQRSDDAKTLNFVAEIDHSDAGDQVLADIESWSDVSVSFDAIRNTTRTTEQHGPITQRAEIRLAGLSLAATGTGLHHGAQVLTLRAASVETPRLTAVRKRLILL